MATKPPKKDNMVDLNDYQQSRFGAMINVANLEATDTDTGDEGGESGSSSSGAAGGAAGPLVDLSAFGLTGTAEYLLAKQIREGEIQFGIVPFTEEKKEHSGNTPGKGPDRHPLLSESQRFDGVAPKLNALPTESSDAKNAYQNRLLAQLQHKNELKNTYIPDYKPGIR